MIAAVEVVAKLGDSIIEIARVERGGSYSSPLVAFPLVVGEATGFVVHRPIGTLAWRCGTPFEDTRVRIGESEMIVLAVGRVTLYVLPILERSPVMPRRRIELRPFAYGAVVLVLHLFVWGLAEARHTEPIAKVAKVLPMRRVHVTHVEPPPPTPPPPASTHQQIIDAPAQATGVARPGRSKRNAAHSGESALVGAFGDVSRLIPSVDVVKLVNESVAYDEQAAEDAKWGNSSGHFDPFRECKVNCGTIASGPYETLSFQNRPRPIPRISIASDDAAVKAAAFGARASLVACHVERALDGDTGTVEVELAANSTGAFALVYSRGLDTVGPCVGAVIDALRLKGTTNARASITIAFTF